MKALSKTKRAARGQSSNERVIFTPCERFERVDFDFGLSLGMSKRRAILYSFEAEMNLHFASMRQQPPLQQSRSQRAKENSATKSMGYDNRAAA
jgi:hypothetical protein